MSLIVLALAVSLDGFGVGLSYGLRKIKIPLSSILVITSCSSFMILVSMFLGDWITTFTEINIEKKIGSLILVGVGSWATINFFRNKETTNKEDASDLPLIDNTPKKLIRINIKSFSFVIEILKVPSSADIDKSGTIKGWEAVLLGTALSLDAFGAGIGASLMGFTPFLTAIAVSILSCLFIFIGMKIGLAYSRVKWLKSISFLPGMILILIGLLKLM